MRFERISRERISRNLWRVGALAVTLMCVAASVAARKPHPRATDGVVQAPSVLPSLVRQIVHDKGNLVTTVDNWGYIGGYSYISERDYPSGNWPRNSGHSYLAEMKYWMGAITPAGDTVVANSEDDFQPMASFRTGASAYNILVSDDFTSYDYDPLDTIGSGLGSPAQGWRVWNSDSAAWTYNSLYSPADALFYPGGPVALKESHYRFNDGARGYPALGLELTQTIYQWDYCYNENFIFVVVDIKNVSGQDYANFAFALYADFDVGGYYAPTGENGRLEDVVDYDSAQNLAWTKDVLGFDPGWNAPTGVMGTKLLQTPDNIGMTGFRTGLWDLLPFDPDQDPQRFAMIDSAGYDTPIEPGDQYYLQCTNGINLQDGKTVRVVFALVAGEDEADLRENSDLAQTLYDNYFVGPQPPTAPTLSVRPGSGRTYLSWDAAAEQFVDPLSQLQDFRGYKLYRSDNLGYSWGKVKTSGLTSCQTLDYDSLTVYRKNAPGEPMPHSFIDDSVTNGVEYWYCLVAFDAGDTSVPIDPLQNSFGSPGRDRNVVKVIPKTHPAGYYSSQSTVSRFPASDTSWGAIWPQTLDQATAGKNPHKVVFYEDDYSTWWAVIDTVTGDTILKDQSMQFAYEENTSDSLLRYYPIANGLQVAVFNGPREPEYFAQTGFATAGDTTLIYRRNFITTEILWEPGHLGSDKHFRSTYEIRWTAGGSTGFDIFDGVTPVTCPFEVWNVTTNQRCHIEIFDRFADGVFSPLDNDYIGIVDFPYDAQPHFEAWPAHHVWFHSLEGAQANTAQVGDVYTIGGAPVNGPADVYYFSPDGINAASASKELRNVKVVPNPYFARASWERVNAPSKMYFTHLPDKCTLRIYTLAGDLVRSIEHASSEGAAAWDLLTESGRQAASGIYYYHIESAYGETMGRFAIVN